MTSDSLCNHLCPFWKRSFLRAQHENPVLLSTSSSAAEFKGTGKRSRPSAWHRPAAAALRLRGGSPAASPGISAACSEISFSSCSAALAPLCTLCSPSHGVWTSLPAPPIQTLPLARRSELQRVQTLHSWIYWRSVHLEIILLTLTQVFYNFQDWENMKNFAFGTAQGTA